MQQLNLFLAAAAALLLGACASTSCDRCRSMPDKSDSYAMYTVDDTGKPHPSAPK